MGDPVLTMMASLQVELRQTKAWLALERGKTVVEEVKVAALKEFWDAFHSDEAGVVNWDEATAVRSRERMKVADQLIKALIGPPTIDSALIEIVCPPPPAADVGAFDDHIGPTPAESDPPCT